MTRMYNVGCSPGGQHTTQLVPSVVLTEAGRNMANLFPDWHKTDWATYDAYNVGFLYALDSEEHYATVDQLAIIWRAGRPYDMPGGWIVTRTNPDGSPMFSKKHYIEYNLATFDEAVNVACEEATFPLEAPQ